MKQPNLFNFATSELSQDAFICWLLYWADPDFKTVDRQLHNCATKLIKALFEKHHGILTPEKINKVEIFKQIKNIDILCVINDCYPILIEDKTGTENHSDQLARYFKEVKAMEFKDSNIIPIYFKTKDQDSYTDIEEQGYKCFLRDDFLAVLNTYKGENQILLDYRYYLQSISDSVNSYRTIPPSKWKWNQWIGFYQELGKYFDNSGWHYVPNQSGGFLGFYCFWSKKLFNERCDVFIHLEQNKLCFKIRVANKSDRKMLRNKWSQLLSNYKGEIKLTKPKHFGSGKYMTAGILANEDYWVVNESNEINIKKTINKILQLSKILEVTSRQIGLK